MSDLTPEEKQELEALRQELNPEEQAELEALRQEQETSPEGLPQREPGHPILEGASHGLTFGFSDHINAAMEAAPFAATAAAAGYKAKGLDGITEMLPVVKEQYNKNLAHEREILEDLEREHPVAFNTGDIAGSITGALLTLGAGSSIGGISRAALSNPVTAASAAYGQGSLHGAGRSDADTLDETLAAAHEGGTMGAVSDVFGGMAIRKGIEKAAPMLEKVRGNRFLRFLGVTAKEEEATKQQLALVGKDVEQWAERMTSHTNKQGDFILKPFHNRKQALESLDSALLETGGELGSALKGVDAKLDPEMLYNHYVDQYVTPLGNKKGGEWEDIARGLERYLYKTFHRTKKTTKTDPKTGNLLEETEILPSEPWTAQELANWRTTIYNWGKNTRGDRVPVSDKVLQKHKEEVAKGAGDQVDSLVEVLGDSNLSEAYRAAKGKYGDIIQARKVLDESLQKPTDIAAELMNVGIAKFTVMSAGLTAMGMPVQNAAMASYALQKIAGHPRMSSAMVHGLTPIIKAFNATPEKYSYLASRLIHSATVSSDAFQKEVSRASAEIDLRNRPLQRTTEEVIRRRDSVLTKIEEVSPDMAAGLRKAIEENDRARIGGIMAAMAEDQGKLFIQEGMGWDGQAVTEADQAKVSGWISSIQNIRKRRDLSKDFEATKRIPEEMMMGSDGQTAPSMFIYQKARDKVRNPRY